MNPAISKIIGIQNEIKSEAKNKNDIVSFMMEATRNDSEEEQTKEGEKQIDSSSSQKQGFTEFVRPARDVNKPKRAPRIQPSTNFMEISTQQSEETKDEPVVHDHSKIQAMFGLPMSAEQEKPKPVEQETLDEREQPSTSAVESSTPDLTPSGTKRIQRATMADNTDAALALENEDRRFLHTPYKDDSNTDNSRRFFKNTGAEYLMGRCKELEAYNRDIFFRFMAMGKAMIDYTREGDLDNFKRLFSEADDKELMFWHVSKSFKVAVKEKIMNMIEFMIEDLDLPLNHEAFNGMVHLFIFGCQEAEMDKDEDGMEKNRQILRYLVKGFGKQHIDQIDQANGSTPLITCCEFLYDNIMVEILVEGGCDINAVNCDNGMPLNVLKARLKKHPDNYGLQDSYDYLKRKGAVRDWRKLTKNPW